MTNLIEKSLLIGFGIFTLTIFSSIMIPFFENLTEFNYREKDQLESYMMFIDEVNHGIEYAVQNTNDLYLKKIEYPDNLNVTFYDHFAKFAFLIEDKIYSKILEYNETFISRRFHYIPPQVYLLNISRCCILIEVNIINLY